MDKSIKKLTDRIALVQKQIKAVLPLVSREIEEIINERIDDSNRIEHLLDKLLDFSMLGVGQEDFHKLNGYYSSIDKTASQFYAEEYLKLESSTY